MKTCENGIIREMTAEEIAAMQEIAAQESAEERHRELSLAEVQEMLVRQQINTLSVDDQTAYRMRAFYPEWADLAAEGYTAKDKGYMENRRARSTRRDLTESRLSCRRRILENQGPKNTTFRRER